MLDQFVLKHSGYSKVQQLGLILDEFKAGSQTVALGLLLSLLPNFFHLKLGSTDFAVSKLCGIIWKFACDWKHGIVCKDTGTVGALAKLHTIHIDAPSWVYHNPSYKTQASLYIPVFLQLASVKRVVRHRWRDAYLVNDTARRASLADAEGVEEWSSLSLSFPPRWSS